MQIQKPRQGYKIVILKPRYRHMEIPSMWEITELSKLCTLVNGMAFKPEDWKSRGLPIVRIQNLNNENADFNFYDKPVEEKYYVQNGDILFGWSGNLGTSFGAHIWKRGKAILNQHIFKVLPNQHTTSEFLFQMLNRLVKEVELETHGSIGLVHVKKGYLESRLIPLPTLKEQQKIASILSNVDSLIQHTQKEIDQTQRLKKGLMQRLLTRGIGHTKFKKVKWNYGKYLEIPENWDTVLLDKVTKRGSGHTPDVKIAEYYNGGIKWVSLADSNKLDNVYISNTEKEISEKGIENSSAVKHPAGVVILSRDAGVGKSAITTTEMAVSQHFMAWQCGDELNNYFLYYLLQFWKPFFEAIAIGTTIKTIGLPFFKKFKIILPPRKEQDRISLMFLNTDKSLWRLQEYKSKLENLKKGLMQKLLTGQIRVKV